ncbi:MAG: adenylate/guanylate cyclase domain-containing protein, partial [Candidatus Entotheonellia bacterium]
MMEAVHRYEGTVNQVLGDGIMALFGAPIAHEDHAVRACYAALAMQASMRPYTDEVRRARGLELRIRVGLHSGEVVVRAIGNDLHMDYSAVGETTHLAARMEQLATPGSIRLTAETLGDQRRLGQVYADMSNNFLMMGDVDRAIVSCQRALALAATLGHVGLQARVHLILGRAYYDTGDYPRAVESFERNVATLQGDLLYEGFGSNNNVAASSRAWLSLCHVERGAFTEGLAMAEEGLRIAETVQNPFSLIEACYGASMVYLRQGEVQRAIPMLERAMGLCQDWPIPLLMYRTLAMTFWLPQAEAALAQMEEMGGVDGRSRR